MYLEEKKDLEKILQGEVNKCDFCADWPYRDDCSKSGKNCGFHYEAWALPLCEPVRGNITQTMQEVEELTKQVDALERREDLEE